MPFRHNIRIGSVLLPTLVLLVGFGGKVSAATIIIGSMVRPSLVLLRDEKSHIWHWMPAVRDDSLSVLLACDASVQISTQVAYIMDVVRYREGALGAIWITLGLANLSMLVSESSFGGSNPILLSAAISLCSGSTLFIVGESDNR